MLGAASRTEFGRRIVNGIFTLGLAVGLTVADLTEGTLVANLGYDNVRHPHPMYHGDTLYVETQVLAKRDSTSRPTQGIVRLRTVGRNQDGVVVIEFERTALMLRRPAPTDQSAQTAREADFGRAERTDDPSSSSENSAPQR